MINIKLIDVADGKTVVLQESVMEGNESLLCREDEEKFPNLCEITEVDIERFFAHEMESLIKDFESLIELAEVESEKEYLREVVDMCIKCSSLKNGQIVFDPFIDRLKHDGEKWIRE